MTSEIIEHATFVRKLIHASDEELQEFWEKEYNKSITDKTPKEMRNKNKRNMWDIEVELLHRGFDKKTIWVKK